VRGRAGDAIKLVRKVLHAEQHDILLHRDYVHLEDFRVLELLVGDESGFAIVFYGLVLVSLGGGDRLALVEVIVL
jgi:hypothetical protein